MDGLGGTGGETGSAVPAPVGRGIQRHEPGRHGLAGLQVDGEAHARALAHPRADAKAVGVAPDVRQSHPGAESEGPGLGAGRREPLDHGLLDVGDARSIVHHVDVDLGIAERCFQPSPHRVDDHVHLRFIGGDHRPADGLRVGADPLEMLLDGA